MMEQILINVLIVLMEVLVVVTLGLAIWSRVSSVRKRSDEERSRLDKTGRWVALAWVLLFVILPLFASKTPILVNGNPYDDVWWLKTTDVMIYMSLLMLAAAASAIIYGYVHTYRLRKVKEK